MYASKPLKSLTFVAMQQATLQKQASSWPVMPDGLKCLRGEPRRPAQKNNQ